MKSWRAVEGPGREIYFPQVHEPGVLRESDFTHMTSLGVLQNALWKLGGVPAEHRTDRLTAAAVHKMDHPEEFTRRYEALLRHYGLLGQRIRRFCCGQPGV